MTDNLFNTDEPLEAKIWQSAPGDGIVLCRSQKEGGPDDLTILAIVNASDGLTLYAATAWRGTDKNIRVKTFLDAPVTEALQPFLPRSGEPDAVRAEVISPDANGVAKALSVLGEERMMLLAHNGTYDNDNAIISFGRPHQQNLAVVHSVRDQHRIIFSMPYKEILAMCEHEFSVVSASPSP